MIFHTIRSLAGLLTNFVGNNGKGEDIAKGGRH